MNKSLILNLSRSSGNPRVPRAVLEINLKAVDYDSRVKVTLYITALFLMVQAVGIFYNMVKIWANNDNLDLTIGSLILFCVNSSIALSIEGNRISIVSELFYFISFSSYYARCLSAILYIILLKALIRAGMRTVCYKELLGLSIFASLSLVYRFYYSEPLEGYVLFLYILPVLFQSYVSFKEARIAFSIGYTFIYKFSQIGLLLFLSSLEAPYSLVPPNKDLLRHALVGLAVVYSVVLAQYLYHPKLFMRYKYLQECMKYRAVRKRVGDLPPKEDGYTCVICMTEFVKDDEVGVLTHCGHFFHEECLEEWLKIKKSCPICKSRCLPMNPKND